VIKVKLVIIILLAGLVGCILTLLFTGTIKKVMIESMSQLMMKMCEKMKCNGMNPMNMCKKMVGN
jgi:hypothetical protein